jgi:hypothetical protein
MPTKRERLDNLTTKVYSIVDDAEGSAAGSVAAINADIAAVQADITALEAVANRNAAQNVELRLLRRIVSSLRNEKRLVRDTVVLARLILALDGGRLRQKDLNGSE